MAAVMLSACGAPEVALPPPPAVIDVTMHEFRFDLEPTQVAAGRVVFDVENAGEEPHDFSLIPVPEDFPPLADHLSGRTDQGIAASTIAVLPDRQPGQSGIMAVDLAPGRYALLCFVRGPDDVPHSRKGMGAELLVVG